MQLKLLDAPSMQALIHGIEAWEYIKKEEINEMKRIQRKALKRVFKLPVITTHTEILGKTGLWPAEQRI